MRSSARNTTRQLVRLGLDLLELDSSPTKPDQLGIDLNSSPIRNKLLPLKKSVAFSEEFASDMMSSPVKGETPRKSILKSTNFNASSDVSKNISLLLNANDYANCREPDFWQPGNILSPPNDKVLMFIDGCISVLSIPTFNHRFEVYASLNGVSKRNGFWVEILLESKNSRSRLTNLCYLIKQDILRYEDELFKENTENTDLEKKNDPFGVRVVAQALKLFNHFMIDQELNNFIPIDDIRWIYEHASFMLVKPNISKALMSAYLLTIKDCRFLPKKKKSIFENPMLIENMLSSLINMRLILSSSIMTEKFICYRNYLLGFPGIMVKNVHHWIGILIIQILSLPLSFVKCITSGVITLLAVAKNFLDNRNLLAALRFFCSSKIPMKQIKYFSDPTFLNEPWNPEDLGIDFIMLKIEQLKRAGQVKLALDAWFALTLMIGSPDNRFEEWSFIDKWLKMHILCFESNDVLVRVEAISSWRAIVYNVCLNDLFNLTKLIEPISKNNLQRDKSDLIAKLVLSKISLLTYPIEFIDLKSATAEELDATQNLVLLIIYTVVHATTKTSEKYLHLYWDLFLLPFFRNLYFSESSNQYLHDLGHSTFCRLVQPLLSGIDKGVIASRCLANDSISLNEIRPLPLKWLHLNSDKILASISVLFELNSLNQTLKFNILNTYLNNVKLITKKEVTPSDSTGKLAMNLSNVIAMLKQEKIEFEVMKDFLINLLHTIDPDLFYINGLPAGGHRVGSIYYYLLSNSIHVMNSDEVNDIVFFITTYISDKFIVWFLFELYDLGNENDMIRQLSLSKLHSRNIKCTEVELLLYSDLCQLLGANSEDFIKELVHAIVESGDIKKNMEYLCLESWSAVTFQLSISIMRDTRNQYVKETLVSLIRVKLECQESFISTIQYLTQNQFDAELFLSRDIILERENTIEGYEKFEFNKLWQEYLRLMTESKNPIWDLEASADPKKLVSVQDNRRSDTDSSLLKTSSKTGDEIDFSATNAETLDFMNDDNIRIDILADFDELLTGSKFTDDSDLKTKNSSSAANIEVNPRRTRARAKKKVLKAKGLISSKKKTIDSNTLHNSNLTVLDIIGEINEDVKNLERISSSSAPDDTLEPLKSKKKSMSPEIIQRLPHQHTVPQITNINLTDLEEKVDDSACNLRRSRRKRSMSENSEVLPTKKIKPPRIRMRSDLSTPERSQAKEATLQPKTKTGRKRGRPSKHSYSSDTDFTNSAHTSSSSSLDNEEAKQGSRAIESSQNTGDAHENQCSSESVHGPSAETSISIEKADSSMSDAELRRDANDLKLSIEKSDQPDIRKDLNGSNLTQGSKLGELSAEQKLRQSSDEEPIQESNDTKLSQIVKEASPQAEIINLPTFEVESSLSREEPRVEVECSLEIDKALEVNSSQESQSIENETIERIDSIKRSKPKEDPIKEGDSIAGSKSIEEESESTKGSKSIDMSPVKEIEVTEETATQENKLTDEIDTVSQAQTENESSQRNEETTSLDEPSKIDQIFDLMMKVSDEELKRLGSERKYDMETKLMEFMMRIRKLGE